MPNANCSFTPVPLFFLAKTTFIIYINTCSNGIFNKFLIMAKKESSKKKKKQKTKDKKKTSKKSGSSDDKKKKEGKLPEIRPGYIVKVTHLSPDGERNFTTRGVTLRVRGSGQDKTFTVRSQVAGVGMEKVFNLNSPALKDIEIEKKLKTRKARLYHLRDQEAKESKKATAASK